MIKTFILFLILRKEVQEMAVVYATLIVKGKKAFKQVPEKLKTQIRELLLELECEHLIEE